MELAADVTVSPLVVNFPEYGREAHEAADWHPYDLDDRPTRGEIAEMERDARRGRT